MPEGGRASNLSNEILKSRLSNEATLSEGDSLPKEQR
jgi:hypothetical protein